jgi:hypothetical protein
VFTEKMKKHLIETEKKGIKTVAFVAIAILLVIPASAVAITTVSIQNVSIGAGESTVVPIMIYDVLNVKGAHFLLSYDPSVVHVEDIGNSDLNTETYKDINNFAGYTRYAVMHVTTNMLGLTGDVKFADVTLKAVGNAGDSSPLNIDAVCMLNKESEEIPREVNNGTFSINTPPYKPNNPSPSDPSPSDGTTDVPIDAVLSWTGGDPDAEDTVTYDVYFGTSINPSLVADNQTGNTYGPGMLDYSIECYWRIVATDNHGAFNESEVWSFTTASSPGSDLAMAFG